MKKHYVLPTGDLIPQLRADLIRLNNFGIDQLMVVDNALKNVVSVVHGTYTYDELLEYLQSVICQLYETDSPQNSSTQMANAIEQTSDQMVDVVVNVVDAYIEKIKPFIFKIEDAIASEGMNVSHLDWEVDSSIGDDIVIVVSDGDPSGEDKPYTGRPR